jgi:hypothetical protein
MPPENILPDIIFKKLVRSGNACFKTVVSSKITGMKKIFFAVSGCLLFFSFQS